jgi:hypothetical protein
MSSTFGLTSLNWANRMQRICLVLVMLGAESMIPKPVRAAVLAITATGQAYPTGVGGKELLRRRALEAALYEAASAGGTDVLGYSASDMAVMVSEQLVVRPASRILDYQILSEGKVGDFYTINIRAMVGDVTPIAAYCARKAQLEITAFVPQKILSSNAPAWAREILDQVANRLNTVLEKNNSLTLSHAQTSAPVKVNKAKNDMDYMALTQGTPVEIAPYALGYVAQIEIGYTENGSSVEPGLELRLTSRLIGGASHQEKLRRSFTKTAILGVHTPLATLNALSRKSRTTVAKKLTTGLEGHVEEMIQSYACRPLNGPLARKGNALTLPFGRADGLTKAHMAYTDGKDQAYILFDIVDLKPHRVTLRPIRKGIPAVALEGAQVRFMETK